MLAHKSRGQSGSTSASCSLADHARLIFLKRILLGEGEKRSYVCRTPMFFVEGETVMTKFGLIGTAALSLLLATPAMAMHHHHHHYSHLSALKVYSGSTYGAYDFYRGYDFARRDTFN